jgi:myo-inositol-1(or 4)-monophosphatase
MDLDQVMRVAVRAAYRSGEILRSRWGQQRSIGKKGPHDLVTDADVAAEEAILATIAASYPGHTVIAEESGAQRGSAEGCWLVDPLDGTVNYAHRLPFFAVSIAFVLANEVCAGVVLNPVSGELFSAQAGRGAFLNGAPIGVCEEKRVSESLLATGFPYERTRGFASVTERFLRCLKAARGIRRFGSAALDLCFVACGRFAGYWEDQLKPWDTAAGGLIVREAGGTATDFSNRPVGADGHEILATNGRIHQDMLKLIGGEHHG